MSLLVLAYPTFSKKDFDWVHIDFIPHIGVGNHEDHRICKRLADDLNAKNFSIFGTIDTLDIVSYENNIVTTLDRILLSKMK